MIIIHVIAHLSTASFPEWWYLWVPVGFVAASGLLGGILSEHKSSISLFMRGVRLLILVLVLNLPWRMETFTEYVFPVALRFEILLPIALTIMVIPAVVRISFPRLLFVLTVAGLISLDLLQWFPFLPKFLLIGVAGVLLGRLPVGKILLSEHSPVSRYAWLLVLFAIVLTIGVHPSLTVATASSLSVLIFLPSILKPETLIAGNMELLGRHSLLLYIFHVALIVVMKVKITPISSPVMLGGLILALILLCIVVAKLVELSTERSGTCRRLYRFILR